MPIDRNIVLKVAELARLTLSGEEKEEFYGQLADIVNYFEKINEIDTSGVEPAEHIIEMQNIFRRDAVEENFDPERFKKIVPELEKDHVVVPAVIEDR